MFEIVNRDLQRGFQFKIEATMVELYRDDLIDLLAPAGMKPKKLEVGRTPRNPRRFDSTEGGSCLGFFGLLWLCLGVVLFRGLPFRFLQLLAFHCFSVLGTSTETATGRREHACFRHFY